MVAAPDDPRKKVYTADEFQPKFIVSLFNATDSVLAVPYSTRKEDVYQNTIINPDHELPGGAPLTLLIEPVNKDGSKRVKDLVLLGEWASGNANRSEWCSHDVARTSCHASEFPACNCFQHSSK